MFGIAHSLPLFCTYKRERSVLHEQGFRRHWEIHFLNLYPLKSFRPQCGTSPALILYDPRLKAISRCLSMNLPRGHAKGYNKLSYGCPSAFRVMINLPALLIPYLMLTRPNLLSVSYDIAYL